MASDPAVVTISGLGQITDPGAGNQTIQFLAAASADTLVLHANSVDQISGFDPTTDVLDLRALLSAAHVDLTGGAADLSSYLTVTDQGPTRCSTSTPPVRAAGASSPCCKDWETASRDLIR
jgi:hypothetical protein